MQPLNTHSSGPCFSPSGGCRSPSAQGCRIYEADIDCELSFMAGPRWCWKRCHSSLCLARGEQQRGRWYKTRAGEPSHGARGTLVWCQLEPRGPASLHWRADLKKCCVVPPRRKTGVSQKDPGSSQRRCQHLHWKAAPPAPSFKSLRSAEHPRHWVFIPDDWEMNSEESSQARRVWVNKVSEDTSFFHLSLPFANSPRSCHLRQWCPDASSLPRNN